MNPNRRSAALTLIELLVAITIIAVLALLAGPAFKRATASGRATACLSNLRQLGTALSLYLGENNMTMPVLQLGRESREEEVPVIDNTLDKYAGDPRLFACPADTGGFAQRTGTSYFWNVTLNGQPLANLNFLGMIEDHRRIPLLADKEGFHPYRDNKVNILYADGHVTRELSFFTGE